MKKTRNVYITVGVMFAAAIGMILYFFLFAQRTPVDNPSRSGAYGNEDYLLLNSLEVAPEAEDLIVLEEGKDCSFISGNTGLLKAAGEISQSIFDGVIVKSTLLSQKGIGSFSESEKSKLDVIENFFSQKGKKVYTWCSAFFSESVIISATERANGVVLDLQGVTEPLLKKLEIKLLTLKNQLKGKQVLVVCDDVNLLSKLNKGSFDGVFVSFSSKADAQLFLQLQKDLLAAGTYLYPLTDLSLYGEKLMSNEALKAYYAVKDNANINKRVFTSYSDVKANKDNCFGALRTYFASGIAPILAFRELNVVDYDEKNIPCADDSVHKVTLGASYLFPVYVNGKSAGILAKGYGEISLDLLRGKNTFTFSQNGKTAQYAVEYAFEGELIRSISPSDKIRVSPGEELVVMVVAYSEAEVFVKLGANKYPAEKQDGMTGYTAFYAKVKMPADPSEISSLGSFSVIATLGNETQQLEGASINAVILENSPATSALSNTGTTFAIQNYNPTYPTMQQNIAPSLNDAISKATTNSYNAPYTGNQTAIVTAEYADVMPSGSELNFSPFCAPLVKGTKDFVIGEAEFYDSGENEWYYYYELACGLKVSKDSVTLEPSTPMPENSFTVSSVYSNAKELTIRLKTGWKVPYSIDFPEQQYYSANSLDYHVSDFTASSVALTFHYTTSVNGEIDCSASNVISAASWSVSAQNKTATLYLPLRERGVFNGLGITYEGDEMVITVKNRIDSLQGKVVVIEPGHGGNGDSGATGLSGTVKESDINILVSYQVMGFLQQQGVTVYMTRYGDDYISLDGIKIFTRSVKADLFVSIHSDAASNTSAIGSSAFYFKPFSKKLANNIHNEILSVYRSYFYPGQQDIYDDIDRGVRFYPFSVTRIDECPSTLIELGFLTNDNECYLLTVPQNQQLLGQAIAKGICDTLLNV